MIAGMNAALSGLQAIGTKVNNNANNVANLNTDGFKKGRVLLAEQQPQGVKATVEKIETQGAVVPEMTGQGYEMVEKSNVDLVEEMPEMIMNQNVYSANLQALETTDEMIGHLLDIQA